MSFMDFIKGLFGQKKIVIGGNHRPSSNGTIRGGGNSTVSAGPTSHRAKQVYEGRPVPPPEWAEGMSTTDLVAEIPHHVKCRYQPSFDRKKIMSTAVGADGNLLAEYDGVAGSCGAVKQFGLKVGKQNGQNSPYRYVDLNLCYRSCCDNPKRCPFYLCAVGEMEAVSSHQR